MDFALTTDQLDLQKSFAGFFAAYAPNTVVRESEPVGFSAQLWKRIGELGVPEMAARTQGDPATMSQLIVLADEYGRRVAPVPLPETLATTRLLDRHGRRVAEGEICTLALRPVKADGRAELLAAGAVASSVVALVGDALVHAPLAGEGADAFVHNLGSSPLANRQLTEDRTVLATGARAREHYARALDDWKILVAAALVGVVGEAHRMTVAYVKERKAFKVPIGWFQTVAHRLADGINDLDGARLLVHKAAWAVDTESAEGPKLASMAYAYTAELAERVTADCLHMHGGVGYTMEHDVQLYFRRAKAWPLAHSDPRDEFLRIADRLDLPEVSL